MFKLIQTQMHLKKNDIASRFESYFEGFQHLIFPNICLQCSYELSRFEKHICAFCWDKLQRTYFESYEVPSAMDQLFWGRIELSETFALYFFEKEKPIQEILHALKYQFKAPLGRHFGEFMGKIILNSDKYKSIEALIPVPIHPQKRFLRGYNQSELLAEGLSNILDLPILRDVVHKKVNSASQTRKNRFLRWDNASEQFGLGKAHIPYRHIAIVDDVITTGSTLEAMAKLLRLHYPDLQISLLSFAIAK
jgi:ComF family protein